jgi:hypothetical protein
MNDHLKVARLAEMARQHADNLARDISNASSRIEHLRLTTLALEAERLAVELEQYAGVPEHG